MTFSEDYDVHFSCARERPTRGDKTSESYLPSLLQNQIAARSKALCRNFYIFHVSVSSPSFVEEIMT